MEGAANGGAVEDERKPLSEVVGDCVQRWFQDALKEARRGDSAMQVLVAQMYHSGYGIPKNEHKVRIASAWEERGLRRHLDTGLQSGKWGQNVQARFDGP
ncbi:hypothetical protein E2562_002887 [Oryza meyeriana var. granulata]|uniref:Uncharacterized protein n=1 Tax=Oryza meyeriana var. granulata TaxID=110450 RepID=A0A6G1DE06_9ORYZ|nr:hypothetical protein E2562_002887 [Oryza meyeriana var. granulata]